MYTELARSALPAPRRACVADARLALSRHGLLSIARLAGTFDVWLPTELREVLRAAPEAPDELLPRLFCAALRKVDRAADAAAVAEELRLWDRLPEDPELAALRLYHLGDRADECVVPPFADRGLLARFEQLRSGLDVLMTRSGYMIPVPLAQCFRDAAALCAVLAPCGGFVLTRLETDERGEPAICEYLEAWGVATARAPDGGGLGAAVLGEAIAAAGLGSIAWSGVAFAAVHVLIEGIPVIGGPRPGLGADAVAARWERAKVFWHLL